MTAAPALSVTAPVPSPNRRPSVTALSVTRRPVRDRLPRPVAELDNSGRYRRVNPGGVEFGDSTGARRRHGTTAARHRGTAARNHGGAAPGHAEAGPGHGGAGLALFGVIASRGRWRREYQVRMSDDLTARTLTEAQLRDFVPVIWSAFYGDMRPDDLDLQLPLHDPDRTHGVFDGDTLIGGGSMLARSMTLPGTGPVPIAAVTSVGVAPDQRRRGALSTLMRAELHGLHDSGGEPVAALWASEGGIYGRFGYGLASRRASMTVVRDAPFRADVDHGGERVRLVDAEAAGPTMRKLLPEYASSRIGGISRPEVAWEWKLTDPERDRGGASAFRFAVLPDGYVRFRVKENWDGRYGPEHEVRVGELVSLTPQAHAALWRFLSTLDLAGEVRYHNAPVDDPLPWMLENPRMVSVEVGDALYVRLVDLDRALVARGYSAELDVVLEVSDDFCPWNAGRWRLSVDGSGAATVRRTDASPDLACGATALGAAFLGSTRLTTLAAAGRVRELRRGALREATTAFAADHEPHCLDVF